MSTNGKGLAPLADVRQNHLRERRHYAQSLSDITDRDIRAEDVRQGFVLRLADGRRVTVRPDRVAALFADHGWTYSTDLRAGWTLASVARGTLVIERIERVNGPVTVYNLTVPGTSTYAVGRRLRTPAHNNGTCRQVTADDLGLEGQIDELLGTVALADGTMTIQIKGTSNNWLVSCSYRINV